MLERVAAVAQHWAVVLGARSSERLGNGSSPDEAGMARASSCLRALGALVGALVDAAQAVENEVMAGLAWWMGEAAAPPTPERSIKVTSPPSWAPTRAAS